MKRTTANFWFGVMYVLTIAALPTASFAQSIESLKAGAKVRVKTVAPGGWRVGYIRSVDSSGINLSTDLPTVNRATAAGAASQWNVPLSSVTQVEVSRSRGSRIERIGLGAVLGGVGGGLLIGAVGYLATTCSHCEESGIGALAGPFLGAPLGFLFGGLAGFASTRERWQPVSLRGNAVPARR